MSFLNPHFPLSKVGVGMISPAQDQYHTETRVSTALDSWLVPEKLRPSSSAYEMLPPPLIFCSKPPLPAGLCVGLPSVVSPLNKVTHFTQQSILLMPFFITEVILPGSRILGLRAHWTACA